MQPVQSMQFQQIRRHQSPPGRLLHPGYPGLQSRSQLHDSRTSPRSLLPTQVHVQTLSSGATALFSRPLLRGQVHAPGTPASQFREVSARREQVLLPETPVRQHREVRAAQTPGQQHREVRPLVYEAQTPGQHHREVRSLAATPQLEHREVRVARPSNVTAVVTVHEPVVASSPLAKYRQVRPVNLQPVMPLQLWPMTAPQLRSAAPSSQASARPVAFQAGPRPHMEAPQLAVYAPAQGVAIGLQSPVLSNRPVVAVGLACSPSASSRTLDARTHPGATLEEHRPDDVVARTEKLIPETPPNTLVEWLKLVETRQVEPAMYAATTTIDVSRYWDKRRIQTCVRRLLEAIQDRLQERLALHHLGHEASTGPDNGGGVDLATQVFQAIITDLPQFRNSMPPDMVALDANTFIDGIQAIHGWPDELTAADRAEVFAALMVPSIKAVRALRTGQHKMAWQLTRISFGDGIANVPYTMPDFPAAKDDTQAESETFTPLRVAKDLAETFASDVAGLELVKDFFLTGLLSLEEIQIALPYLAELSLLEKAVELVIRTGTRHFTQSDVEKLVYAPRTQEMAGEAMAGENADWVAAQALSQVSTEAPSASPQLHRESPDVTSGYNHSETSEAPTPGMRSGPATAPLPTREVRNEEAVMFQHSAYRDDRYQIVDWKTALNPIGRSRSHKGADEAAGLQAQQPLVQPEVEPQPQDIAQLLCLEWHQECKGPFLARAFVKCCQIYQEQMLA